MSNKDVREAVEGTIGLFPGADHQALQMCAEFMDIELRNKDEVIKQLDARTARLSGLFEKLKTHGQFFYSAIELDHDIDGEAFEVELDQVLAALPKQSLAKIQADFLEKLIDECPELLPGETGLWTYLYEALDKTRSQANQ